LGPAISCLRQQIIREPIFHIYSDTLAVLEQIVGNGDSRFRMRNEKIRVTFLRERLQGNDARPQLPIIFECKWVMCDSAKLQLRASKQSRCFVDSMINNRLEIDRIPSKQRFVFAL